MTYTAYITPRNGIPRRYALISFDRAEAMRKAQLLGAALYGAGFTFSLRGEA
jgi:hypothetical protein